MTDMLVSGMLTANMLACTYVGLSIKWVRTPAKGSTIRLINQKCNIDCFGASKIRMTTFGKEN